MSKSRVTLLGLLISALFFSQPAMAQNGSALDKRVISKVDKLVDKELSYLFDLYKYLHANPELSYHEVNTAKRIARELRTLGFQVTEGVGGHGIVAILKNGDGPTVMVRTDLDALPVQEQTGLPYASKVRTKDDQGNEVYVMHACGHDMHMTSFVGTARVLSQLKDYWRGTLMMIGQPAEERGGGARAMLADGLFERFPRPNFALALHVSASLPAGTIGYREGYALANVDAVDITIRGAGGHGAYPHRTKDPIVLAAQTILALQTIVSREIAPIEPAVVTVGSIHGGTKHNIIPDEAHLQLTLRSYSDEVRNHTIEAIKRITRGLAMAAGVPEDRMPIVTVADEYTPATYNDPELTLRLAAVLKQSLGEGNVIHTEPVMGGEDFGRYGRVEPRIPICIFWLGTVDPAKIEESKKTGKPLPSLHSSLFAPVPEPSIRTGVKAMATSVLELLKK
ncbi:MAG: amidohydrolase [candidate division KSB1 bacterium]|nr:amidohydrolase [candidate division KSB1 bacterium]